MAKKFMAHLYDNAKFPYGKTIYYKNCLHMFSYIYVLFAYSLF